MVDVEAKKAVHAIDNIIRDPKASDIDKCTWLMSIAAIALEEIPGDIRQSFFKDFEALQKDVHQAANQILNIVDNN